MAIAARALGSGDRRLPVRESSGWPSSARAAGGADNVSAVLRGTSFDGDAGPASRPCLGIEFAQVARDAALGNVEAGLVASLTNGALLDRLGRVLCVAGLPDRRLPSPAFIHYDARARPA